VTRTTPERGHGNDDRVGGVGGGSSGSSGGDYDGGGGSSSGTVSGSGRQWLLSAPARAHPCR